MAATMSRMALLTIQQTPQGWLVKAGSRELFTVDYRARAVRLATEEAKQRKDVGRIAVYPMSGKVQDIWL